MKPNFGRDKEFNYDKNPKWTVSLSHYDYAKGFFIALSLFP